MQREKLFTGIVFFITFQFWTKALEKERVGSAGLWMSVACELRERLEGLEEALVSRQKGKLSGKDWEIYNEALLLSSQGSNLTAFNSYASCIKQ